MKRKVKRFPDELALKIALEYLTTDISQSELKKKYGFTGGMTQDGNPLDNAIAERINGILKVEWLYEMNFKIKKQVKAQVKKVIEIYNTQRPHSSIGMLTPEQAHNQSGELKRLWKNYWKIPEQQCQLQET